MLVADFRFRLHSTVTLTLRTSNLTLLLVHQSVWELSIESTSKTVLIIVYNVMNAVSRLVLHQADPK